MRRKKERKKEKKEKRKKDTASKKESALLLHNLMICIYTLHQRKKERKKDGKKERKFKDMHIYIASKKERKKKKKKENGIRPVWSEFSLSAWRKLGSMVAGSCCSSIRTFRICLSQNWKTTRNQFGWKCLQTKLLILWQVGIGRLVALVKNSNYLENSLITLGLIIRVKKSYPQPMS